MADTARVRNQLATTRQAAATPATTGNGDGRPSPAKLVRLAIERQTEVFKLVLPSHVDPERFSRLTLTAVKSTPELMRCFSTEQGEATVMLAAMQAAAIGLEPNTPMQDCWLTPRPIKGVWECQLSIGYRGFLRLARRSGNVSTAFAEVVHENDEFEWSRGLTEDHLHHKVPRGIKRGDRTHAYAVARFKDGGYSFIVLDQTDVEARRAMSDSYKSEKGRPYSPWTKWPGQMWRKSGIRALVPYLDLSVEAQTVVSRANEVDERQLILNREERTIDVAALDAAGPLAIEAGDDEGEQDYAPDDDGRPFEPTTGEIAD